MYIIVQKHEGAMIRGKSYKTPTKIENLVDELGEIYSNVHMTNEAWYNYIVSGGKFDIAKEVELPKVEASIGIDEVETVEAIEKPKPKRTVKK
jgi:hypothetical protein